MIASIVSGLINSRRRTLIDIFSPSLRKLWKEWDLRVTILLSLTLQIILIIMGNRRKYSKKLGVRVVAWSAYLAADSIATFSLGILANNITDVCEENVGCTLDANIELTALWAPFLLLHLGGPDTITAYSLEDNELWLRHFLGLIVQTAIAVYVFLMAWTGSRLSIMSILMFFAGLIKYGERTWALRSATHEKLEQRSFDTGLSNDILTEEFNREKENKMEEGYWVAADMANKREILADFSDFKIDSEKDKVIAAFALQGVTMNFFIDLILSPLSSDKTYFLFGDMSSENAFKVIEINIGLIYHFFYTKASLIFTPCGLALRFIAFILTCVVLVLFAFLDHKHKYSKVDVYITFLLLVVGVILDIYSAFILLSSDLFLAYLHKKIPTLQIPTWFPLFKSPRWSNIMPQYSILSVALEEKPLPCHYIFELFKIHGKLQNEWYVAYEKVLEDFKSLIFCYLKEKVFKANYNLESRRNFDREAGYGIIDKAPRFEESPWKSILFWHIVTEIWYYADRDQSHDAHCKLIKQISRYMMYLLVMHPSMVSLGITQTHISAREIALEFHLYVRGKIGKIGACKQLVEGNIVLEYKSEVLREAVSFIREMKDIEKELKWKNLGDTWLEMLAYTASKCKGREHAQQLRSGGEMLTHVWLLIAFFGLTDHFGVSERPKTGRLIAK